MTSPRLVRQTMTGDRQVDDLAKQVNEALRGVASDIDASITSIGGGTTIVSGGLVGVGPYASMPSSPVSGQTYYTTDGLGPWVYDGSVWRPIIPGLGVPAYAPPTIAAAGWTNQNAGTSTFTDDAGRILLGIQTQSVTTDYPIRGMSRPLNGTSSDYVEACFLDSQIDTRTAALTSQVSSGFGVGMRESGTGKVFGVYVQNTESRGPEIMAAYWPGMASGPTLTQPLRMAQVAPYFLRVRRVTVGGTDYMEANVSRDRVTWILAWSVLKSSAFTGSPDQALVFGTSYSLAGYAQNKGHLLHFLTG